MKQRLNLDYARGPFGAAWLGWAVLAAGVLATSLAIYSFLDVSKELGDQESKLARLQRKPGPALRGDLSAPEAKRYAEEIKFANAVAERLTYPWEELFTVLESTKTSVALLALEPDVAKKLLRITIEAKNKSDMLAYMEELAANKQLVNVHLVDHQLQAQVPGQPVRFSLQASWLGQNDEKH